MKRRRGTMRHRCMYNKKCWAMLLVLLIVLVLLNHSCAVTAPRRIDNSCAIFKEKSTWYKHTVASRKRWGISIGAQLAIIHQESRFVANAKSPRSRLLWIIPWVRNSSAYGFGQVVDGTWQWYRNQTGNTGADRDDFADTVDFIGWYVQISTRKLGIQKNDVYRQYLAFHEGQGGFARKSYNKKPWLIQVAKKVAQRARVYDRQLQFCAKQLQRGSWWWPF